MNTEIQKKLFGKRAVITGGSRGIGEAIARAYLQEGAEVVLVARNSEELSATQAKLASRGRVGILALDVSDQTAVERCARTLAEDGKPVDILVNAAGIYGPIGRVDHVDPALWLQALEVNLFGTFLMTHYLVPLLTKSGRGVIINFVGGGEGAKPHFTSYVSAKGGIARFTETVAAELQALHVAVNAVAPGAVNTKFLDDLLAAGPGKAGKTAYESALKQKAVGGTPPEKTAALAVWLASDASQGLTGKVLSAVWDDYDNFPERMHDIMSTDVYTMRRVRQKE
jgi:NAD(P)-dependent dehydrogenase (short-subunit alcohol dehydrogenase family)